MGKNQGTCGSCWAFSTVCAIEGANVVNGKSNNVSEPIAGTLISLSEQELIDCSTSDAGCNGGNPIFAFRDMIKHKMGLEAEDEYPYAADNGICLANKTREQVFITDWTYVSNNEDQIAAALVKYGPLAISVNSTILQFYRKGVLQPTVENCDPKGVDHGVNIVGFGEEQGVPYWTVRNSWGVFWGERGYYRIVRGTNACGLANEVKGVLGTSQVPVEPIPKDNLDDLPWDLIIDLVILFVILSAAVSILCCLMKACWACIRRCCCCCRRRSRVISQGNDNPLLVVERK